MPSYNRQRKKWIARVRISGQPADTKAFDTKREALAWEAERRKQKEHPAAGQTDITFLDAYSEYLDFASQRYSKNTYVEKTTLGRRFIKFASNLPLDDITAKLVSDFILYSGRECSANRANRDRKNLLSFWNWCQKVLDHPSNPVAKCDRLPHKRAAQYVPMEWEVGQLLMVASAKERVFINCYLQTAARRSSVFRWKWGEDIDFRLKQVRIGCAKNREGSMEYIWLPMTRELEEGLTWWYKHRTFRDAEHVWVVEEGPYAGTPFTFRHKFLKGLCSRAGIKSIGFHSLRRYAATRLAQKGVSMSVIQRILGHKNLSTTERYLGRCNEDLRATMELLGWGSDAQICKPLCKPL